MAPSLPWGHMFWAHHQSMPKSVEVCGLCTPSDNILNTEDLCQGLWVAIQVHPVSKHILNA